MTMTLPPFQQLVFVGLGGFLGANARYILSGWVANGMRSLFNHSIPYGTLFVNGLGSFLLAIFSVWFVKQIHLDENVRLLIGTGFFGAFTTFSTFANESVSLFQSGNSTTGILYIALTNLICLGGVLLGLWITR